MPGTENLWAVERARDPARGLRAALEKTGAGLGAI